MKIIFSEIRKTCHIPFFMVSVLGVVCTCLLNSCYMDENGTSYTVFRMILDPAENAPVTEINQFLLWAGGFGTWSYFLLPFLLGIGYVSVLSAERKSGEIRFMLIREGTLRYCLSKMVSHMLCGGIFLLFGYILYGILLFFFFPSLSSLSSEEVVCVMESQGVTNLISFVTARLFGAFLYGMLLSLYSFAVAVFFSDAYVLMCLPMMLSYLLEAVLQKIEIGYMNSGNHKIPDGVTMLHMNQVFSTDLKKGSFITLGIFLGVYLIFGMLFFIRIRRNVE